MTNIVLETISQEVSSFERRQAIQRNLNKLNSALFGHKFKYLPYTTLKRLHQLNNYYKRLLDQEYIEIAKLKQLEINFNELS